MAFKESVRRFMKTNRSLLKVLYYSGLYFIMDTLFDKKGVYILCYHRLSNLEPGSCSDPMSVDYRSFEKHLEFLKGKYELISMDQAAELLSPKKRLYKRYMAITFDDGYQDNYLSGREIFSRYAVRPTIYLAAGKIDDRTWLWHDQVDYLVFSCGREEVFIDAAGIRGLFPLRKTADRRTLSELLKESIKQFDEDIKDVILHCLAETLEVLIPEECGLLLDWESIRHLTEIGADMGGHTMNHPILSRLSVDEMKQEVTACKKLIEEHTHKEVRHFAYPNGKPGDHTEETATELKNHYKTAVTTIMGVNLPGADLYELRRILIGNDPDILRFRFKLLQAKICQALNHGFRQYE